MPQIIPPVLFGLFLLSMVPVTILCPGSPMLPAPFQWTGLAVVALGLFFLKKGHGTFISQETEIHTFRQPTRLVTSGIYALSRNPMYLGFLLMLLGVAVCTNEALNVLFAIVFFWPRSSGTSRLRSGTPRRRLASLTWTTEKM